MEEEVPLTPQRWTITEPFEGRHRPIVEFGGKPLWCQFDYAVWPAPECDGVEIRLAADADAVSTEWFPHLNEGIRRGIQQSLESWHENVRELVGIRVEIRKIYTHPIDTTVQACLYYGSHFVSHELWRRSVQLLD